MRVEKGEKLYMTNPYRWYENDDEALSTHIKRQVFYKRLNHACLYLAFFGGPIGYGVLKYAFNPKYAEIYGITALVFYGLGYLYCSSLNDLHKDSDHYRKRFDDRRSFSSPEL